MYHFPTLEQLLNIFSDIYRVLNKEKKYFPELFKMFSEVDNLLFVVLED